MAEVIFLKSNQGKDLGVFLCPVCYLRVSHLVTQEVVLG
jgi:hypothetical protein